MLSDFSPLFFFLLGDASLPSTALRFIWATADEIPFPGSYARKETDVRAVIF
jgi:hypothetical protein